MSAAVGFVVSAGGLTCAVLAGMLWLYARPPSSAPRRFLLSVAIGYLLATIYGVSYLFDRVLSLGYAPFVAADVPKGSTAIVVLGSSSVTAKDWLNGKLSVVDAAAASRVLEAVRVYGLVHADWVISSGGQTRPYAEHIPSGITMREELVRHGVPLARIIVETTSTTTHEEAVIVAPILASLHVDHVILVTSQAHMRRSIGTFRQAGVDPIPAIARDPHVADPWRSWLVPSNHGLEHAESIVHEILGLGYYAVRGWYKW